jgi:hypothetical protein
MTKRYGFVELGINAYQQQFKEQQFLRQYEQATIFGFQLSLI